MLFLTRTPLGRMANASRDNFERVQFVGYDPRMVRFLQFALSGFFAGIGGGLYAITYEIVTFDALAAPLSANALLMAYIGGSAAFGGPILGAVLITLLQSGVSLMSNSWLVYVGVLFITMVIFAPQGIMGLIAAHGPIVRAGRFGRLLRAVSPGHRARALSWCSALSAWSSLPPSSPSAPRRARRWCCSATRSTSMTALPWLAAFACLVVGDVLVRARGARRSVASGTA